MTLFNETVLAVLEKHGEFFTQEEINQYKEACKEVEEHGVMGYKTKKNKTKGRERSIFHAPKSDTDPTLEHWLVLPGERSWITKNDDTVVMKNYVNLETGEERVMKIRRPDPNSPMSISHMGSLYAEQTYNGIMGEKVSVYTRFHHMKGTKGYLLQTNHGRRNLKDLILDPMTEPSILQRGLIESGLKLKDIHKKGYLHLDFKAENVVVEDSGEGIHLVDLESMTKTEKAKQGINQLKGTKWSMQTEWYKENLQRRLDNKPIFYDTANDVIAYLKMAELIIATSITREKSKEEKARLNEINRIIEAWVKKPMKELPYLDEVLDVLQQDNRVSKIKLSQ